MNCSRTPWLDTGVVFVSVEQPIFCILLAYCECLLSSRQVYRLVMILLPATDNDLEFGRRVHHTAYRKMVIRQFGEWDDSVADMFFEKTWKTFPHHIISTDEGEKCGYCAIERTRELIQLREIAILPEFQGQGIGTTIVKSLVDECEALGIPMRLNVLKTNKRAAALYDRLEFQRYGENENHYLLERSC